jgi:hypothetical protein
MAACLVFATVSMSFIIERHLRSLFTFAFFAVRFTPSFYYFFRVTLQMMKDQGMDPNALGGLGGADGDDALGVAEAGDGDSDDDLPELEDDVPAAE